MKWEIPACKDIRFGFEVTMYINNKQVLATLQSRVQGGDFGSPLGLISPPRQPRSVTPE